MTDLPPLPEPDVTALSDYFLADGSRHGLAFTHDQMRAYAAAALADMTADRDKYKAFAEQFARMLVEHGIIKDAAAPIPGAVVHLGPQEQPR